MENGRCHNGRQPKGPRTMRPRAKTTIVTVGLAEPLAGELGPYLGYRLDYVGPGSVLEGR